MINVKYLCNTSTKWTFKCLMDISVRPMDEWAFWMSNAYFCMPDAHLK